MSVILNNDNNQISIIDKFNRNLEQLIFGIEEQILPFVVIQNTDNTADKLTVGDIRGRLPYHENILSYQLIESPQYGEVFLDAATGEWQYRPDPTQSFSGVEQFDCAVTFKNGMQSAPLSIQIQSEKAPFILRPGKKIFIVPDPIYAEPEARHQIVPVDMQVHAIQLAQLHLQSPDAPYFNLVSNRWALLKVDVTSQSNAEAPDFMVRITDKHGHLLGETRLIGPRHLPQSLLNMPNEPAVDQRVLHRYSYTAPLKGAWIQPNIRIQIMAGDTPITQPFTDNQGVFAPTISQDSHLITRVSTSNLYQQGHGTYAYSPISWGKEAIAKLPASQLSLYSYPSQPLSPALYPHFASRLTTHYLTIPSYDKSTPLIDDAASQISWAYDRSLILKRPNGLSEDLNYYAITPSINSSLLGLAVPHAGGGVASIDVLAHEAYGHGVGLPHTTHPDYPYDSKSNGTHAAYDPQLQRYMTYRSKEGDNINEIIPLMYPYAGERRLASYDAIAPHSDYDTQKALQFFQGVPRWMPNSQKGQDTEDSGFLGEGYYQRWSKQQGEWVTLTENNFAHYYNEQSQYLLPHQRDVPVYQLNGKIAKLADGQPHPYNELQINRTTGTLPADYHNIHTQEGRPYNSQWPYVLKIIYATPVGLHTEILQALPNIDSFSINIADKGELVSIEIIEINQQKQFGKMLHRYNNPEELTNRVFGPRNQNAQLKTLQLDNFWQGSQLFWSVSTPQSVDFNTGTINQQCITPESVLRAKWIENGRLHQRYFSLSDPDGMDKKAQVQQPFFPLNHLIKPEDSLTKPPLNMVTISNYPLLSDAQINQYIDISELTLTSPNHLYWVTLLTYDEQGSLQESSPLESWYIEREYDVLHIQGAIDSTPNLKVAGIKVYIGQYLQDTFPVSTIIIQQNTNGQIAENIAYTHYNQPVIFNSIEHQPELLASVTEYEHELINTGKSNFPIPSTITTMPIAV